MAKKEVSIEAVLDEGFAIKSQMGQHTLCVDQPTAVGGTDTGPTPLQYFLLSLAGCMGAIGRIVATQKKLSLRGMTINVNGTIETNGLMGKYTEARTGFDKIEILVDMDADMTLEEKQGFLKEIEARCPIADNVLNATVVSAKVEV
jgi:putative redox protein